MSVCPICGGAVFRGRLSDQEREGPVCGGHPNEELAKLRAERDALWEAINLIPEPLLRPEFYGETDWGRAILKLKEQA